MIQVKNRACVRTVAVRSLWASKMRNLIAVIAIMLTTMLFTALFTIAISINDSFQQSNFLMVGGYGHGAFKKLTEEQMETLKKDPLIQETGARLFLGMGTGDAFRKTQVEVSYMDAHGGKHYFCTPTHGHRPKEGSNEAMTDTRVLKLLGVQPKIGTKFTVTYQIGGVQSEPKTVTQEFVLSGWWDYNGVSQASHVIVPKSYVKKTLQHVEIGEEEECGTWTLDVCAPAQLRKVIPARRAESRIIHPGPDQVVVNQSFCLCATPASAQWSRRKGYVSSAKYRKKICYVQWLMP